MSDKKNGSVDPKPNGRVARLRAAMLAAVSEEDIAVIMTQLCYLAKQGNVMAAREVLDRCLGSGVNPMTIGDVPATGGLATVRPAADRAACVVPLPKDLQGEPREILPGPVPTTKPARPGGSPFD